MCHLTGDSKSVIFLSWSVGLRSEGEVISPCGGLRYQSRKGVGRLGEEEGSGGRWRPLFQLHPRIPWKDHQAAWFVMALGSVLWLVPQSGQMFRLQQGAWKIPTLHTHPTGSHIHTCLRTNAYSHTHHRTVSDSQTPSHTLHIPASCSHSGKHLMWYQKNWILAVEHLSHILYNSYGCA